MTATAALIACAISVADAASANEHWPQFRGPGGAGVAPGAKVPTAWSAKKNVDWAVEIPGRGWSSPIVWGRRLILTSAVSSSSTKQPGRGLYGNDYIKELIEQGLSPEEAGKKVRQRDIEESGELTEDVEWLVLGLDAITGKIDWARRAHRGRPAGGRHRKRMLEPREIYLDFGTGSSPVVGEEHLYVLRDNDERATLEAYDKKTGEPAWTVERGEGRMRSGWSTPFLWRQDVAAAEDVEIRVMWRPDWSSVMVSVDAECHDLERRAAVFGDLLEAMNLVETVESHDPIRYATDAWVTSSPSACRHPAARRRRSGS